MVGFEVVGWGRGGRKDLERKEADSRTQNEFETILQERNVVENLNRLEDLIADAKKRKARSTSTSSEPPYVSFTFHPSYLHSLTVLVCMFIINC